MNKHVFKRVEFLKKHYESSPLRIYQQGEVAEVRDWLADRLVEMGIAKLIPASAFEELSS